MDFKERIVRFLVPRLFSEHEEDKARFETMHRQHRQLVLERLRMKDERDAALAQTEEHKKVRETAEATANLALMERDKTLLAMDELKKRVKGTEKKLMVSESRNEVLKKQLEFSARSEQEKEDYIVDQVEREPWYGL